MRIGFYTPTYVHFYKKFKFMNIDIANKKVNGFNGDMPK